MAIISKKSIERGVWSAQEHDRFLVGLKLYPEGPWKLIAAEVGTRSARQVQTHAQKYYEKVARRLRGLRKDRKKLVRPEHRLDEDMVTLCKVATAVRCNGPVRRGLNPVVVPVVVVRNSVIGSPTRVDASVEEIDMDTVTQRQRADSIDSLLEEEDDEEMELSSSDSDASDASLLDCDGSYLDYLIEILGDAPQVAAEQAESAMVTMLSECDGEIICAL
ncbi:Myb-like dna-binding protein [Globisporangium polare]